MHGVKKSAAREARKSAENKKKIEVFRSAMDVILKKKNEGVFDAEGLSRCEEAIGVCPDANILWNYRKQALLTMNEQKEEEKEEKEAKNEGGENSAKERIFFADDVVDHEMKLLEVSIEKFPKSYWIWHHRRWLTQYTRQVNWERELKLCDMLLKADPRNFHGWRYRRFVTSNMGREDADEFAYTETKINENFSNYSAWHQRSLLLLRMYKEPSALCEALRSDIELVRNAMYVEPKDQSAWVYYDWLINHILGCLSDEEQQNLLESEIAQCDELLDIEPDSKYALLTKMRLCVLKNHGKQTEESKRIIDRLIDLDSAHAGYYRYISAQS